MRRPAGWYLEEEDGEGDSLVEEVGEEEEGEVEGEGETKTNPKKSIADSLIKVSFLWKMIK